MYQRWWCRRRQEKAPDLVVEASTVHYLLDSAVLLFVVGTEQLLWEESKTLRRCPRNPPFLPQLSSVYETLFDLVSQTRQVRCCCYCYGRKERVTRQRRAAAAEVRLGLRHQMDSWDAVVDCWRGVGACW